MHWHYHLRGRDEGNGCITGVLGLQKMQSTYIAALSQYARMHRIPVSFSDIRPGFVATDILLPGTPKMFVMPVRVAATHILKGLERRKRVIVFDWRYRVTVFIWKIIPEDFGNV